MPAATPLALAFLASLGPQDAPWAPDGALLAREGGSGTQRNVRSAIAWLRAHQADDGHWSSAGFGAQCKAHGGETCGGAGVDGHDVGATGLAILTLTTQRSTLARGEFADDIARAVDWLAKQRREDVFGGRIHHDYVYDHTIATYALCEALRDVDDAEPRAIARERLVEAL